MKKKLVKKRKILLMENEYNNFLHSFSIKNIFNDKMDLSLLFSCDDTDKHKNLSVGHKQLSLVSFHEVKIVSEDD